jgi:hypothetical protein
VKNSGKYLKDYGDAFMIQMPLDVKITYNEAQYDLIGTFEILGSVYGQCPVVEKVDFDLGIYNERGDEINTFLHKDEICRNLRLEFQQIMAS